MYRLSILAVLSVACGRSGFERLSDGNGSGAGDGGADSSGDGAALGDTGGADSVMVAGIAFQLLNGTTAPPVRRSSSAALQIGASEVLWMYGGYSGGYLSDLRSYSLASNSWITPAPNGTPPGPRERHVLAWDPADNAVVMFGGQNRPMIVFVHYDELWMYATGTSTWTQVPKAGTWPTARKDAAMFWVPHLGKLMLFGGNDGTNTNNRNAELYLMSLNAAVPSATWQLLAPTGVTPPAQSAGCVVYDPTGHRMILYGGETTDGVDNNKTYQYLLDTNTWQLDTTTGTTPPGQSFQQCAWLPTIGRVAVYGGQMTGGTPLTGQYLYDPNTHAWSSPPVTTGTPGNRSDGGAVYSPALDALLWYGGRTGGSVYTSELVVMTAQ